MGKLTHLTSPNFCELWNIAQYLSGHQVVLISKGKKKGFEPPVLVPFICLFFVVRSQSSLPWDFEQIYWSPTVPSPSARTTFTTQRRKKKRDEQRNSKDLFMVCPSFMEWFWSGIDMVPLVGMVPTLSICRICVSV